MSLHTELANLWLLARLLLKLSLTTGFAFGLCIIAGLRWLEHARAPRRRAVVIDIRTRQVEFRPIVKKAVGA